MQEIIHTIGRRKTSVARLYLSKGKGAITINNRDFKNYFHTPVLQTKVKQPLAVTELVTAYDVKAKVEGGGTTGQAEAVRLAIARALVKADPELRPKLKAFDLFTRDPRMVERKKFGKKKARKGYQFSKR